MGNMVLKFLTNRTICMVNHMKTSPCMQKPGFESVIPVIGISTLVSFPMVV